MEDLMDLTPDKLNKLWEVATTIGAVEGWMTDIHDGVHVLTPFDREEHYNYQRKGPDGEWEKVPGAGPR
jgi:hypothetical protein